MDDRNQLGKMILNHWLAHRPRMVEELRKNNQLERAIQETQERTGDPLYELLSVQKMEYHAAWEIATREWTFLPSEDPQEHSTSNQN